MSFQIQNKVHGPSSFHPRPVSFIHQQYNHMAKDAVMQHTMTQHGCQKYKVHTMCKSEKFTFLAQCYYMGLLDYWFKHAAHILKFSQIACSIA